MSVASLFVPFVELGHFALAASLLSHGVHRVVLSRDVLCW